MEVTGSVKDGVSVSGTIDTRCFEDGMPVNGLLVLVGLGRSR